MAVTVTRACYCNRQTVMRAVDFTEGIDKFAAADRAIETAAANIDEHLHRVFYPQDGTRYFDWPNQGGSGGGQYAYPWRLWLDDNALACLTAVSSGGVSIGLDKVFLEPVNNPAKGRPYYTYLELDRSTNAAFGGAQTPQHSIALTGTWSGGGADADQVATLAANVATTDTSITVSDSSKTGVGDLLVLGYGRGSAPFPSSSGYAGAIQPFQGERVLVTDVGLADTGLAQSGAGCETADTSDQSLTWSGSGSLNAGEVVQLDSEQMLVEAVAGSVATVRRQWNGTTLATHSAAEIYAYRSLTISRAMYGTAAVSASSGDAVHKHRVPGLIRDLSLAEAINQVLQEGSGYARTVGSGESAHPAPGQDLAAKWAEAMAVHGRNARIRAV